MQRFRSRATTRTNDGRDRYSPMVYTRHADATIPRKSRIVSACSKRRAERSGRSDKHTCANKVIELGHSMSLTFALDATTLAICGWALT